jgi:16S rRNA (uracil1498-N3)-methyltransferase
MPASSGKPAHRLHAERPLTDAGGPVIVSGAEAHHAAVVKRVRVGEPVAIHDGAGGVGFGTVESISGSKKSPELAIIIERVERSPVPTRRVEVWSAVPKGDRAGHLIDQLSQVGVGGWRPLVTARSVAEAGEHRLERLQRVAVESMKQSGRAWLMDVGPEASLDEALAGAAVLVAQAGGVPAARHPAAASPSVRVLVGPEGGFTDEELDRLRAGGAELVALGPHVMRIETAAVAAGALLVNATA